MILKEKLALEIIKSRYHSPINAKLGEYLSLFGAGKESVDFLLDKLMETVNHPLEWGDFQMPATLNSHVAFFKNISQELINKFREESVYKKELLAEFFNDNHIIFKYATKVWLIVNAGICFEFFNINSERVPDKSLEELFKRGVKVGDSVLHLHLISNDERKKLSGLGFPVPHEHWEKSYYIGALYLADQMLNSNPASIGLFCKDSWVFDPALHQIASDGKPYVTFSFLKDDVLVGERFFVSDARPDNVYFKQFDFALRSSRRLKFYQNGEYKPKAYGFFYSKEQLRKNIINNKLTS